jgi:phenylacetate-coenzyme A ligase PaaK-like adenylate-forming protein
VLNNDVIFSLDHSSFEQNCLTVFRQQYQNVSIYRRYVDLLKINPDSIHSVEEIPFIPVQFFKSDNIIADLSKSELIFTSSGTTSALTSKHLVKDIAVYKESFRTGFELFYGPVSDYCVLALLPS